MTWERTKKVLLFIIGLLGFAHETLFEQGERTTLIIACLALMGLPIVNDLDKFRRENKDVEITAPKAKDEV